MSDKHYLKIVEHYENCLRNFGDNHLGVDWPKEEDAQLRYKIMLEIIPGINPNNGSHNNPVTEGGGENLRR